MFNKKNRVKFSIIVLIVILLSVTNGVTIAASSSSQINISTQTIEKINQYIDIKMKEGIIPGLSIAIVKSDGVIYEGGFGKTGNGRTAVTIDTPFVTGSLTKSITALAIKQLIDKGILSASADVTKYIPWFTLSKPDGSAITVSDLINHTSGLLTSSGEEAYTYNSKYSLKTLTEEINRSEHTQFMMETESQYSNLNYVILGYLIEVITGESYTEYINNSILSPLEMNHSGFDDKSPQLAAGNRVVYGFNLKTDVPYPNGLVSTDYLISSTSDLSKYLMLILNNGYITKDKSMLLNSGIAPIDLDLGSNQPYYDILWNEISGPSTGNYNGFFGAIGTLPNYNSAFLLNQDEHVGIVILTNQYNSYKIPAITAQTIANDITDIMFGKDPYQFRSKSQISIWLFPIFAFILTIFMLNEIIKIVRILLDRRKNKDILKVKYINGTEIIRVLTSLFAYFGFPVIFNNSWRFFVATNPELVLPILWIIVINILTVLAGLIIRFRMIRNFGGIK